MNQDEIELKKPDSAWPLTQKAAAAAVFVNVLLTGLKFVLAWWSKSLALKVEAYHSLADVGSSLAVLWALRSGKTCQADISPARHRKWADFVNQPQRLVALFIGVFLLVVGTLFLRKIIAPEPISVLHPLPVGAAMLVLALFSFLLARLELVVGEKEASTALIADSFHSRVDMFNSLVVAGALLGEGLRLSLDRLAAALLAVFILTQAVNVFGAVIRGMGRKDGQPDYLYREWLWILIEKRLLATVSAIITRVIRLMGGSPESAQTRRKAVIAIATAAVGALVLSYLVSGLFTVQANERAFLERLGKPVSIESPLGPGLHWRWPWPIDRVRKVDVAGIRMLSVGSAVAPGRRTVLWTNQHYVQQFNLLSGENILVDVGVVIHYRVIDAAAWLYNTQNPESLLASITLSELTETFSRLIFLETITAGRNKLEADLALKIKDSLSRYQTGIEILSILVRDAHPPIEVAPDFEMVVSAAIEYETRINEAKGYQNALIPRARGAAVVKVVSAQAEKTAARNRAVGDAQRYKYVQQAYAASPTVMSIRLRNETAESVLPGREKIIVPAEATSGAIELFMTANPGWAVQR